MTHFGCGVICSDSLIANCLLILTVKNFENRLIFGEVMRRTKMVPFLAAHPVQAQEAFEKLKSVVFWRDVACQKLLKSTNVSQIYLENTSGKVCFRATGTCSIWRQIMEKAATSWCFVPRTVIILSTHDESDMLMRAPLCSSHNTEMCTFSFDCSVYIVIVYCFHDFYARCAFDTLFNKKT